MRRKTPVTGQATLLHRRVSPATLGVVRAWVFAIWVVKIVYDPLPFLARLPPSSLTRYGVVRLVPERALPVILTTRFLTGFKIVLVALCVLAMVGARPWRVVAPMAAVLLTFQQGLVRGFTTMTHQELALLYCTYVLAVVPAASAFALPPRRRPAPREPSHTTCSAALITMTAALLVAYTSIAAHRLATSGPAMFVGNNLAYWLAQLSGLDPAGWQYGLTIVDHPEVLLVAKVGFAAITGLELLAPLCLVNRRFRMAWVAVIIPFHVVSCLTMNIFFWEDLLLMLVLLVDIEALVTRASAWQPRAWVHRRSPKPHRPTPHLS